ncbi:hypothetical protein BJ165DRAFT_1356824 [Panaeolus papilionaceus]|nr:hypothetical protein BJ165DRAFT_1356824 [Panaeolus papilionaceus]
MDVEQNYESTDGNTSSNSSAADSEITEVDDSADETAEQELVDEEPQPRNAKTFTASQLTAIRLCISDAVTPTWLARPPANLGDASHGKLKADEWLVLCTVFLPLILPEIWYDQPFHSLLANFIHLATCTNLLSSHSVTHQNADLYTYHYTEYRCSCLELFPDVNSRPNHHFAMHNGELMKYWGPLIKISEFLGERGNGTLQKIPTNGRIRDMDLTMIRQLCRRGRLNAYVQRQQQEYMDSNISHQRTNGEEGVGAARVFHASLDTLAGGTSSVLPKPTADSHTLPNNVYDFLLSYVNFQRDIPLRRYDNFPHPTGAKVYPHWATPHTSITIHGRTYTIYSQHRSNASIHFSHPYYPQLQMGFINSIWSQQIEGARRTFLIVQLPVFLSQDDAIRSPYAFQGLLGLMGVLVYSKAAEDCIVVETEHVRGHVPFYIRPPGTFGIEEGTMVMLNSLHRYRF